MPISPSLPPSPLSPVFQLFPRQFRELAAETRFPRLTKSGLIDHPLHPLIRPCFPAQRGKPRLPRIFQRILHHASLLPRSLPRLVFFFFFFSFSSSPRLPFSRRFLPLVPLTAPLLPPFTDASQTLAGILRRIPFSFLPSRCPEQAFVELLMERFRALPRLSEATFSPVLFLSPIFHHRRRVTAPIIPLLDSPHRVAHGYYYQKGKKSRSYRPLLLLLLYPSTLACTE